MGQYLAGGCGSAFACNIVSERFEGMKTLKQHQLVNGILKEEIAEMHAFNLRTKPKSAFAPEDL
jgi:BolA-like protein 3